MNRRKFLCSLAALPIASVVKPLSAGEALEARASVNVIHDSKLVCFSGDTDCWIIPYKHYKDEENYNES